MDGSASDADVRALKVELKKAEAALKRSKTKDYYKILGVARDCSEAEIKKGYRKESLKHHPDKVSRSCFLVPFPISAMLVRAATKKNSSWWLKPMPFFLTHIDASGMTWARMKMG